MKLSTETLGILKNFSSINMNILLSSGSVISTRDVAGRIRADAITTEEFPIDFGIYDLKEFIGVLSLFKDPTLDFNDKYAIISEGNTTVKYFASNPSVLTIPKNKTVDFPECDVNFTVSSADLLTIQKSAIILRSPDIAIIGDSDDIVVRVCDKKNVTGNSYEIVVGKTSKEFSAFLKIDNLKLLQDDYNVSISNRVTRFSSKLGETVTYFIAIESDSKI